ncbi:MAG TPA: pyrimidine-nucleoside phosphorylase, partial [Thermoleophilia bacterium]
VQGGRWKPGEFPRLAAHEARASRAGYLTAVDAMAVGQAAQIAGAGRQRIDDTVDPAAGVRLECAVGDRVDASDVLAAVFSRDPARRASAGEMLGRAFTIGDERPQPLPLVLGRLEAQE